MGCDIHFYVEKNVDGKWISADKWIVDKYMDKKVEQELYDGRNYSLFAILADVRNGYGFAGCKTGEGFKPISSPRGLPVDMSQEVGNRAEMWGLDGHSHSWLTVEELDSYDWNQKTQKCGWVGAEDFKEWKENGIPSSWCGGVSGPDIKRLSNEIMNQAIISGADTKGMYTEVEWEMVYRDCVDVFLSDTMPKLRAFGDPDKVRIVFWFDN